MKTLNERKEHIKIYLESCVKTLESESGRIVSGFFRKLAYPDKDFEISVRQTHQMEFKGVH